MKNTLKWMICQACFKNAASQAHHRFSQSKLNRKLYGKLLDDSRNIQPVCAQCHGSHASVNLIIWNELTFCKALGIEPRSRTGKAIWKRMKGIKNES